MSPIATKVKDALLSAKNTAGINGPHRNIEYKNAVSAWNGKAPASQMFDSLVDLKKQFSHNIKYLKQKQGLESALNDNIETVAKIDLALEALKTVFNK